VVSEPRWLGESEGPALEYKRADSLRDASSISREVAAMLNQAGGGIVVVGVEDDGRFTGVPDAVRERDRILQVLLDTIEPTPIGRVAVEVLPIRSVDVLQIRASPARGVLYAERRKGRYGFWARVGAMTRPLPLEEVTRKMRAVARPSARDARNVEAWWRSLENDAGPVMVLRCAPDVASPVRGKDVEQRVLAPDVRRLIEGREMGWHVLAEEPPRIGAGRLEVGARDSRKWLSVDLRTSEIRFEGRRPFLEWKKPEGVREPVLYPYALVEGTVSFLRFAGALARECSLEGPVRCELGLWGIRGWRLGPHRPGSVAWELPDIHWKPAYDAAVPPDALHVCSWEELAAAPDVHARAMLERVYEWFGYADPKYVPFWSDPTGRFEFGG
jgi:hypothetical protein